MEIIGHDQIRHLAAEQEMRSRDVTNGRKGRREISKNSRNEEPAWHEAQWQQIKQAHEQNGRDILTFTPEYCPSNYLHTLPHTNVPVADLWNVCLWAAERARQQLA